MVRLVGIGQVKVTAVMRCAASARQRHAVKMKVRIAPLLLAVREVHPDGIENKQAIIMVRIHVINAQQKDVRIMKAQAVRFPFVVLEERMVGRGIPRQTMRAIRGAINAQSRHAPRAIPTVQ